MIKDRGQPEQKTLVLVAGGRLTLKISNYVSSWARGLGSCDWESADPVRRCFRIFLSAANPSTNPPQWDAISLLSLSTGGGTGGVHFHGRARRFRRFWLASWPAGRLAGRRRRAFHALTPSFPPSLPLSQPKKSKKTKNIFFRILT